MNLFLEYDEDLGGTLDHDEFTELLMTTDKSIRPHQVKEFLRTLDADGDGDLRWLSLGVCA